MFPWPQMTKCFCSRGSPAWAKKAVLAIDNAVNNAGIIAHRSEDVNGKRDTTVIGVDVIDGMLLTPSAQKMMLVLIGLTCVLDRSATAASILHMQTILGHLAWFALLARHTFSCLHSVYDFARGEGDDLWQVPHKVIADLALFAWLLVCLLRYDQHIHNFQNS